LPSLWSYNKSSLLYYLLSASKGFNGVVTNTSGNSVRAKVYITGHDVDSSHVYSSQSTGFYARPIEPGTWQVTYSSPGYASQTHTLVIDNWESSIVKNVQLLHLFTITFDVKTQITPIVGANVHFNGVDILTNSEGKATFSNVTEGNASLFSVSRSGYQTLNGQTDVNANKTIYIDLTSVGITTPKDNISFTVWPNPFNNELNIKFNLEKPSFVNLSIYSIDGRLISTIAYGSYQAGDVVLGFSGAGLGGGSYLIKLQAGEKTFSQIIQHIP